MGAQELVSARRKRVKLKRAFTIHKVAGPAGDRLPIQLQERRTRSSQ